MNEEYKTFEELKEELGDKFEEYMYKANINLLNNWNELKNILKARIDACKYCDKEFLLSNSKKEIKCLESILGDMQELEVKNNE